MGFGPTEEFLAHLKQLQAEGKIILPGELVRRVKAGPGPQSLGDAQRLAAEQATEQQGIVTDTLTMAGRLESAWSGPGGDAARGSLRPLADLATSASAALRSSQNTLTDQAHAFTSTRNSLQDVSDDAPSRTAWDLVTPWDTDNEDRINQRNASIQQNNAAYQSFTATSDGHAQRMPIDYGQVPHVANDTYALKPAQGRSHVESKRNHSHQTITPSHAGGSDQSVDRPGSTAVPPPTGHSDNEQHSGGRQQPVHVPAASHGEDGTHAAEFTLPGAGVNSPPGSGPAGYSTSYVLGTGPGGYNNPTGLPEPLGIGGSTPGGGSGSGPLLRGSGPGGPDEPGKATGSGRLGGTAEPGMRSGSGPGAAGARGANGMPLTAGTGKGDKEEDKEHKTPDYLQEADPNALFGYDGKATPPVIGK
jgi:hypothetical protein